MSSYTYTGDLPVVLSDAVLNHDEKVGPVVTITRGEHGAAILAGEVPDGYQGVVLAGEQEDGQSPVLYPGDVVDFPNGSGGLVSILLVDADGRHIGAPTPDPEPTPAAKPAKASKAAPAGDATTADTKEQ